jgi:guanylate kinase
MCHMQNLILLDGVSGAGKSDLLSWVIDNNSVNIAFVKKATTRARRPYETTRRGVHLDLEFMTEEDFENNNFDYMYKYGGNYYGFQSSTLVEKLKKHRNVLVIVRSTSLMEKIERDFPFVNIQKVFLYTPEAIQRARLLRLKLSESEIKNRIKRSNEVIDDYVNHQNFYNYVLFNERSRRVFHASIRQWVDDLSRKPLVDPAKVAVMMSYEQNNAVLQDIFEAISRSVKCVSKNLKIVRVDTPDDPTKISSKFKRMAASCIHHIVDLTGDRQNVYYELGYLHAKNRVPIITAHVDAPKRFYPREYTMLTYQGSSELENKLTKQLKGVSSIKRLWLTSSAGSPDMAA